MTKIHLSTLLYQHIVNVYCRYKTVKSQSNIFITSDDLSIWFKYNEDSSAKSKVSTK